MSRHPLSYLSAGAHSLCHVSPALPVCTKSAKKRPTESLPTAMQFHPWLSEMLKMTNPSSKMVCSCTQMILPASIVPMQLVSGIARSRTLPHRWPRPLLHQPLPLRAAVRAQRCLCRPQCTCARDTSLCVVGTIKTLWDLTSHSGSLIALAAKSLVARACGVWGEYRANYRVLAECGES